MKELNLFIELIRLKKPIGFMLLFWPCAWGLTIAYNFQNSLNLYFFYIILFFLGSVLMRSAGCIVNDIFDRDFDKKVLRTKSRPIASGRITVKVAILYSCILCLLAFLVLLNFNYFTIILALGSMPLAFTYPLMKRLTYWPQLFLGVTFNYGLILGWTAVYGRIDFVPLIFYVGAIFWTLGYDTVYGYQDIKDDEIIGLKSTSIKFKNKAKQFLITCYLVLILILIIIGYMMSFSKYYYFFLIIPFIHLFVYQLKIFDHNSPENCLKAFKSNNLFGLIVLLNILIGKFI
ncbi:MAG: 4-hydroxybenzoate octaprenyltransferase [Candidatus Pelagibacter sp.]|jgi:4-hydroxybenzoate polyprenyltransferase